MCRFAPIAPSSGILPLSGVWQGVSDGPRHGQSNHGLGSRLTQRSCTGIQRRSSSQYIPVRRVDCQLGCLDVWQKRHARTAIVPPKSALAFPGAPACASATPLDAANAAFLPGAWRGASLGCTLAPVLALDAEVLGPQRPPPAFPFQLSPLRPAAPQTMPPAARSARISAVESPAPPHPDTPQSFGPGQRRTFCFGTLGRAAAPPPSVPIQAEAARKPRI